MPSTSERYCTCNFHPGMNQASPGQADLVCQDFGMCIKSNKKQPCDYMTSGPAQVHVHVAEIPAHWPVCGVIMFSKPAWISRPPGSSNRSLTVSLLLYLFIFIYIIQGTVSGSIQATDRLMKELRDVYRSESFKRGALSCTS